MNSFRQHIPRFIDSENPTWFEFSTTQELLAHPSIHKHSVEPTFFRFSKSAELLMLESDGGKHWWVLGRLGQPELVDLPEWECPKDDEASTN